MSARMYRVVGSYLLYRAYDNHQEEAEIDGWIPAVHAGGAAAIGGQIVAMGEHDRAVSAMPWQLAVIDTAGAVLRRYRGGIPVEEEF